MTLFIRLLFITLFFASACQQKPSLASLRSQFLQTESQLLIELEAISSPHDFEAHEKKASELFEDIAEAMLVVNTFSVSEQEKEIPCDPVLSDALKKELKRLLTMPGGEEWLIKCQAKAVRIIDIQSHKAKKHSKK